MSLPRVIAVTVNWNLPLDTLVCLDSLSKQDYGNLEFLVVDNGSNDDSVSQISKGCPRANIFVNPKNLGFAGGYNTGIRAALEQGADFVFILNNDTFLDPSAVRRLVEAYYPGVGILAPFIYFANSPQTIWSMGGKFNPYNLEIRQKWFYRADPGGWPAVIPQDFVNGCGMLFPRSMLEKVGLFDERFYLYYEDADLCYRTRLAKLSILVVPGAKMWHKVSTSSGGGSSPNERYWMARSSIRYFKKYTHGWRWLVVIFWRSGSALRTSLRMLRWRRMESLKAYWRGLWAGVREKV